MFSNDTHVVSRPYSSPDPKNGVSDILINKRVSMKRGENPGPVI